MTIARLIAGRSGEIFGCETATTVREAVALLAQYRIGALPVLADGAIVGIFSERDLVNRLAERGPALLDETVGAVMTAPVISIDAATGVMDALAIMTERRFRHLPVVEAGRMVAFVSIGDLVKYRIERIEAEAEAMRSYIQTA
ncbi:MAG: CBS domain-containing protein [Novosphingobium sp.]